MRQRTTVITRELPEDDGQASGSGRRGLFAEVDPLLQSEGPLDESEQDKLIQDFQDIQLRQARTWRAWFGGFALLVAALYAWSAYSQAIEPWGQRHVGEFRSVVQSGPAIAVLSLQAAALGACALAMLMHLPAKGDPLRGCMAAPLRQKLLLGGALLATLLGAVFWAQKLAAMRAKFGEAGAKWELAWVPGAPVLVCVMCSFVSASLDSTAREVARLQTLRYQHRKV